MSRRVNYATLGEAIPEVDIAGEGSRFLQWAESDKWGHGGASSWADGRPASGSGLRSPPRSPVGDSRKLQVDPHWMYTTAPTSFSPREKRDLWDLPQLNQGASGSLDADPWGALLEASDNSEFITIPAPLLQELRKVGEAQLREIEALRSELAAEPQLRADVERLERQLADVEASCLLAANEAELRRQEAEDLDLEAARLREQLKALEKQRNDLRLEAERIETWLPDSRLDAKPQKPKSPYH